MFYAKYLIEHGRKSSLRSTMAIAITTIVVARSIWGLELLMHGEDIGKTRIHKNTKSSKKY